MKKILAILLILCCGLPVMAKKRQNEEIITPLTQLEKRQFQTKTYPAQDNIIAMKSILNVLQDEGFIVYNVNSLLGYIYGVKDFDISDPNVDISKEFGLTKSRLNYNGVKVATLEVSINVTQYGEQSRIRANFKRKLFNEYGNAQMIDDIDEAEFYSDFYQKVDTAITLQKEIANKVKQEETPVSVKKTIKTKPPVRKPAPKPEPVVIQQEVVPQGLTAQPEQVTTEPAAENKDVKTKETVQKPADTVENTKPEESAKEQQTSEIQQEQTTKEIKSEPIQEVKEEIQPTKEEPQYTPEQILDLVPVDKEPEHIKTSKEEARELKELVKQAKAEAKQAQKEALQAQKEAMQLQKDLDKEALAAEKEALKAEKQALKEAKRQAKEMRE